jgi:hypothetical protein
MTTRRDLLLGVGALVALQLLTSFSAIGVLTRTAPAVAQVLEANVYSLAACEDLLGVLGRAGGEAATPGERARAASALERLRLNLTEPGERELVEQAESRLPASLEGDLAARRDAVSALLRLGDLNRAGMRRADAEMQRLGAAGAWFAVALAVGAFLLSMLTVRRLERRLLAPLEELGRVLESTRAGRWQRRCQPVAAAPDVKRLLEGVNEVLDTRLEPGRPEGMGRRAERAALLHLLDARPGARFVVDRSGRVAAASRAGLAALAGQGGDALRERLAALAGEEAAGAETAPGVESLADAGWLWEGSAG